MALNEPKMRSITGKLVANKLTERDDDFSFNVTYQANRSVKDLCKLAATNSKFTASELESAYNDLMAQAKIELYNASTVEFGFANNSLGVDGPFIGPDAKFDPSVNNVTLRCSPRIEFKEDLKNISVIVAGLRITPGGGLNGEGNRVKITGSEGQTVGFFFVSDTDKTEIPVPVSALLRNDPSFFSFIIPQLNKGAYYLEVATQASTNSKKLLKEPRRNRFPYPLYVGNIPGEEERPGEL